MSVIITGMDMPIKCEDCPCAYFTEGEWRDCCQVTLDRIIDNKKHLDSCPLKSIDGLLDYIKHDIANIAWYFDKDWDDGFDYLSKVIKEYCEVEE